MLLSIRNGADAIEHFRWPGCEMVYSHSAREVSGGPHQAESIGWKELQKFQQNQMQNLAPGIKKPNAMVQAGDWLGGEQLCWKKQEVG